MSRIGKKPVDLPQGVSVRLDGQTVEVKGPKGVRSFTLNDEVTCTVDGNVVTVAPRDQSKRSRSMWGMTRTMIANLGHGVTEGFSKELEINGVGYRAAIEGKSVKLSLGFSHDVLYPIPDDIDIKCPKPTSIVISGIDQQRVGQVAAELRRYRPPEPYKGKGVKYVDEYIFRKEGKKK